MSATGNPRNKVALKPGHSLMDWIRLGNSGEDLAGVGGAFLDVTKEQLEKHNKTNDAWLCIRGKVYNVTKYMDYHPGGQEELMRGVGTDATSLFNQVHAWVNYESILQKCVVGRLRPVCDENTFNIPSSSNIKQSSSSDKGIIRKVDNNNKPIQMDWFQQLGFVTLVFYTKTTCPQVHVLLKEENLLYVQLNQKMQQFKLESSVSWPAAVSVDAAGKVQIKLNKKQSGLWKSLGKAQYIQDSVSEYWNTTVKSVVSLTHDTKQIDLMYQDNVFNYIPVAHHVFINRSVNGDDVLRPYTPVSSFDSKIPSDCVRIIVKGYSNGIVSSWLCSRHPGDYVHISGPRGSFDTIKLGSSTNLALLAAGTGITPMISLITWALTSSRLKVHLMFFNKTERDIILQEELDRLMSDNSRFSVEHVLSEASAKWSGRKGRVSLELLQSLLPDVTTDIPNTYFVCVCGPTAFTQIIERCLKEELQYSENNYCCFLGQ